MIYFQSKYLAEKFNINLSKWKRWSREFLPPDPLGGLRSGYARQFSHKDAFTVYLGGYLVSGLKFTVPEAKQILADLEGWLNREGFYALPNGSTNDRMGISHHIYIICLNDGRVGYSIRSCSEAPPIDLSAYDISSADPLSGPTTIPGQVSNTVFGARLLLINHLYRYFLSCLHR